ncbi:hypothetical protein Pint_03303 [Pistacia integerrima]|uniref:Uncharacterized protein n=1 Tax=Pistacia integerrima TaxID=434235 RepID=A0ACC0ZH59_9ROSI|nr:hypothetical protein Pint_03303 [Pistacia integerrima]
MAKSAAQRILGRMYSWWWDSHISPKKFQMASGESYGSSNNGEAFPNQIPFAMGDDGDPRTPEMGPRRALVDHDELQNDSLGLSSSHLPP